MDIWRENILTIFVIVAFAFFLKLLISVASKVDFNFLEVLRILKTTEINIDTWRS